MEMELNEQKINLELYEKLSCEEKAVLDSYGIKLSKKELEDKLIDDLVEQNGIQFIEPEKKESIDLTFPKVINKDNAKKVLDGSIKAGKGVVDVSNKFFDWFFNPSKDLTPKQLAKKRKELFG